MFCIMKTSSFGRIKAERQAYSRSIYAKGFKELNQCACDQCLRHPDHKIQTYSHALILPQKSQKQKNLFGQTEPNTLKSSLPASGLHKIFLSLPVGVIYFSLLSNQSNNYYMSTASNIMEEDYEIRIQTPELFAKMHDEDDEPGQVGFKGNSSHLSENISIISSSFRVQEYLLQAGEGSESVGSAQAEDQTEELAEESQHSSTQSAQNESENTEVTHADRRTKARKDNNNNIHKFFITEVNDCLKARSRLKPIQQMLKSQNTKFNKGSRPSFVFRLIDIRRLFGKRFLAGFLEEFRESIQKYLILPDNPTPVDLLLKNLVPVYEEASHLFEAGDAVKTVIRIYTIDKAKEEHYKKEGVKKVEQYLAKRSSE